MPDEDQLFLHPPKPPRPASQANGKMPASDTDGGLELIMRQIAGLPTRRELARWEL
jgi:hypothetical protein